SRSAPRMGARDKRVKIRSMVGRCWFLCTLVLCATAWAQTSSSSSSPSTGSSSPTSAAPSNDAQATDSASQSKPGKPVPDLSPPRSDRVNASDLSNEIGESSSKDTQIDFSAPDDDAKKHPESAEALVEAEAAASGNVTEMHVWDPHKAAKSVE